MSEGMSHICDVEGPKKTRSVETRLEGMEQQVFKCQGMLERGLNANHMMITEFTSNHKMDAIDIGKHLSRLYDRVDKLQGQIYDLQNQNSLHLVLDEACAQQPHPWPAQLDDRGGLRTRAVVASVVTDAANAWGLSIPFARSTRASSL
ncbi:40S ribosomal protein S5-1 [Hordeum vulgare]|nr:40S ribosomal protein S5-1 [Hordeum vulgare]